MTLPDQLRSMRQSVDADTGAILFRHPTLQGIPDLAVEGDGTTMELMGPTLLCLDIIDPGALGRQHTTSGVSTPEIPKRFADVV